MGKFKTTSTDSGAVVVRPTGKINMVVARTLRDEVHALIAAGNLLVIVDLSAVELIDSSGLGALISGLKAAREAGGDLRIAAPNKQALKALEITNLDRILSPHATVSDALADPV